MPRVREGAVCFGRVVAVQRHWTTKIVKSGTPAVHVVGCWTYRAFVEHAGRVRKCMISRAFYAELRARGTPREKDFVGIGSTVVPKDANVPCKPFRMPGWEPDQITARLGNRARGARKNRTRA